MALTPIVELGVDEAHARGALERLEKTGEALRGKFGIALCAAGGGARHGR